MFRPSGLWLAWVPLLGVFATFGLPIKFIQSIHVHIK
jgi:hypothetical protein